MKKSIVNFILIVAIMAGVVVVMNTDKKEVNIRHMSMTDITSIMESEKNYIILDVRTKEEYDEGHIPNAINIPNETIGNTTVSKELKDKNQLILVYCRSGNRSKQAVKKLEALGYTNIIEFGGIIDWQGVIEK